MFTVREDTTLVGISELRTRLEQVLEEAKRHKVVIEKRNRPIAVLVAIERYNAIEAILDKIEDYELARLAMGRERKSSRKDYMTLEAALRKAAR